MSSSCPHVPGVRGSREYSNAYRYALESPATGEFRQTQCFLHNDLEVEKEKRRHTSHQVSGGKSAAMQL